MLFTYPAIFHKEDSSVWVEFPDLEGCQTFADSLNEAIENSQEALASYLLTLVEDGREITQPSDIMQLVPDADSFTSLVSCRIGESKDTKSVKKTLTIPSWLNQRALSLNLNFSKILQDALLEKIQQ